jgi:hypothetical protein
MPKRPNTKALPSRGKRRLRLKPPYFSRDKRQLRLPFNSFFTVKSGIATSSDKNSPGSREDGGRR